MSRDAKKSTHPHVSRPVSVAPSGRSSMPPPAPRRLAPGATDRPLSRGEQDLLPTHVKGPDKDRLAVLLSGNRTLMYHVIRSPFYDKLLAFVLSNDQLGLAVPHYPCVLNA